MKLEEYLKIATKGMRAESFAKSNQLTLGEIISKIESIIKDNPEYEDGGKEAKVYFDFAATRPTGLSSWRGSYAELAIEYSDDSIGPASHYMTVFSFLKLLKDAIGHTFEGYKGGDFTMTRHTPVWVANYGHSDNTGVIEVVDKGWCIILITAYCEY